MADSNLTIGATFDKGQLDAAIAQGSEAVKALPDAFNLAFREMSTASGRAMRQISADTKASAATVGESWKGAAAAAVEYRAAQTDVRAATKLASDSNLDEAQTLALLAAAKQKVAVASVALAAAESQAAGVTDGAAAANDRMEYSMAYGAARIGAYAGGVGSLGYAIGSVAARMQGLAPIMAAAFDVAAPVVALYIIEQIAESVKKWYDNAVLLRQLNTDLATGADSAWKEAASANWQYIQGLITTQRETGNLVGAYNTLKADILDEPLTLKLDVPDKDIAQLEKLSAGVEKLKGEMAGVNTLGAGQAMVGPIKGQIGELQASLKDLEAQLKVAQSPAAQMPDLTGGAAGPSSLRSGSPAQIQAKIDATNQTISNLQAQLNIIASKSGSAGHALEGASNAAAKAATKLEHAATKVAAATKFKWMDSTAGGDFIDSQKDGLARLAAEQQADIKRAQQEMDVFRGKNATDVPGMLLDSWEAAAKGPMAYLQAQTDAMAAAAKADKPGATQADMLKKSLSGLGGGMDQMVNGILRGTQTIGQAWDHMAEDMATSFVTSMAKVLVNDAATQVAIRAQWLETHLFKMALAEVERMLGIHDNGNQTATAVAAVATATGAAMTAAAAAATASAAAATATAAAASSGGASGGGGVIGSALGIIGGVLGIFDEGGVVPNTGLHMLHAQEMVLPRPVSDAVLSAVSGRSAGRQWAIPRELLTMAHPQEMAPALNADALRGAASGGRNGGGSGRAVHIHYNVNASAIDGRGMRQVLHEHAGAVADAVSHHMRALNRI